MVSTVLAFFIPVLLIGSDNYYTCKTWPVTETVDSSISYVDSHLITSGSVFSTAIDLNNPCNANDECKLGNGGTDSTCSTNCICSTGYVENSGTCEKATDLNNACSGNPECVLGNGGANSICNTNCECNTGYTENAGTCAKATDLNNPCGSTPECTLGNGGAGAICSTNCVCDASNDYTEDSSTCKKDCGSPPSADGYVPEASPASTLQGATASVTCAADYTGTAAQITCGATGSWSTYSGCSSGGTRTKLDVSLITVLAVLMLVLI